MDDFPRETPRFWIAFGILCVAAAFCAIMAATTQAHAQEVDLPICGPGDAIIRQIKEVKKQRTAWEGVITLPGAPPAEAILTQDRKGNWSLFVVGPQGTCLIWIGEGGTAPIETGDGA